MIISRALLLAATAAACPGASRAETIVHGAPGSGDNLPQFQLNWSDEFDQGYAATGYPLNNAPDPTVWDRNYFGVSTWYKGQVNPDDETQIYMDRPENVRVEDGALVLELRADGRTAHPGFNDRNGNLDDLHTSGHVVSKAGAKTFSRVGRIEFRAKIPSVQRAWPALWAMGQTGGWPACGEIDVLEFWGKDTDYSNEFGFHPTSTIHWADANNAHASMGNMWFAARRLDTDWHLYAFERDTEKIRFFFDDVLVWTADITDPAMAEFRDRDSYLLLNFAYQGIDLAADGVKMYVDYVREYLFKAGVRRHEPPVVGLGSNPDTGGDLAAYVGQPLPVVGAVVGDGMTGGTLTYEWQCTSGPGVATFADPAVPRTSVTFAAAGTYEIRLLAHDGEYAGYSTRRVVVTTGSGNTAPMIAINYRTVTAGQPVKLSALVADDGRTTGPVAVTWRIYGTATISDAHALEPTVTFTAPGSFMVLAQADDGELSSAWARSLVTVKPAATNQAPAVVLGAAPAPKIGEAVTLPAEVIDDGLPEWRTIYQWTQVSGPAAAAIDHADRAAPTATFPAGGTYVLRLTASDGAASTSADLTVNVGMGGNHAPAITTAKPAALACNQNGAGTVALAATDPDTGDTLAWTIGAAPAHGAATVGSDGQARYVPATGFFGTDAFVVQVGDGHGGVDSITVNCAVARTVPLVTAVSATPAVVVGVGSSSQLAVQVSAGAGRTVARVALAGAGGALGDATYDAGSGRWTRTWGATALGRHTFVATAYGSDGQTSTGSVDVVVGTAGTYGNGGAPWAFAGDRLHLEAENYDNGGEGIAYHDIDAPQYGTLGNRSSGSDHEVDLMDLSSGTDTPGMKVAYTAADEWLRYTVTVPASGCYALRLRVANGTGATAHDAVSLRWKGATVAGPVTVPATADWLSFTNVDLANVQLAAGTDLLEVYCNTGNFDLNWIELARVGAPVFADWIAGYFPGGTTAQTAPMADPDGDGLDNILEYGLGRAPDLAEPAPAPAVVTDGGDQYLALTFRRAVGVDVTAEISSDLATWSSATADIVQVGAAVPDATGLYETVTFRSTATTAAKARQFLRVRVTAP